MCYFNVNLDPHFSRELHEAEKTQTLSKMSSSRGHIQRVCCADEELDALILFQSLNQ